MAAIDTANKSNNVIDPALNFAAVTPHASTELSYVSRALYVGTGGNVVAVNSAGAEVSFVGVPSGTILPIRTTRVDDTSTASDIVALW